MLLENIYGQDNIFHVFFLLAIILKRRGRMRTWQLLKSFTCILLLYTAQAGWRASRQQL